MKPVVFLDVDGVINDLGQPRVSRPHTFIESHGYTIAIPDYMPSLIRHLVEVADVYWLTTWRERANDEIADFLGIPALPVLTDGTSDRMVSWKDDVAQAKVAEFPVEQAVYWIEDFYGALPQIDGIYPIDTTGVRGRRAVLLPSDLPGDLIEGWDWMEGLWGAEVEVQAHGSGGRNA